MNRVSKTMIKALAVVLAFTLCGGPQLAQAWQSVPDAPSVIAQNRESEGPPLQSTPVDTQPDSSVQPNAIVQQETGQTQKKQPVEPPAGVAGAQQGPTAGGAASQPAGLAIAPAKQTQVRSFLIKVGAIAAIGVAAGTIYALSRSTSSVPPGSGR